MVEVKRDASANGVCLLIHNLATGNHLSLNPLELEALTRALSPITEHRTVEARKPVIFQYPIFRFCL